MPVSSGSPGLPRAGDRFGRYLIDAEVGRGGMGVVYRATDTETHRIVALKVVAAELTDVAGAADAASTVRPRCSPSCARRT